MVPGGGLSEDRTTWLPSRTNFFVPLKALSPISRTLFTEEMRHAGLLEHIEPQVWTIPWHVHSQATHHGHSACTSRAPYVLKGAISNKRMVSRTGRTVTCTDRTVGRARLRTTPLDVMELLRRFLQHVFPAGFLQGRHCGVLHASCAIAPATIRLMMEPGHPREDQPTQRKPTSPLPRVARCPTCDVPRHVVRRVWTSPKGFVDTS